MKKIKYESDFVISNRYLPKILYLSFYRNWQKKCKI